MWHTDSCVTLLTTRAVSFVNLLDKLQRDQILVHLSLGYTICMSWRNFASTSCANAT